MSGYPRTDRQRRQGQGGAHSTSLRTAPRPKFICVTRIGETAIHVSAHARSQLLCTMPLEGRRTRALGQSFLPRAHWHAVVMNIRICCPASRTRRQAGRRVSPLRAAASGAEISAGASEDLEQRLRRREVGQSCDSRRPLGNNAGMTTQGESKVNEPASRIKDAPDKRKDPLLLSTKWTSRGERPEEKVGPAQ